MQVSAVPPMPAVPAGLGSLAIYLQQGSRAGLAVKRGKPGTVDFLVVPRGRMGFREGHAQRFPMNGDGWAKAWLAFRTQDAGAAGELAPRLLRDGAARVARLRLRDLAGQDAYLTIPQAVLAGGYRVGPLTVGSGYLVQFLATAVRVADRTSGQVALQVRYEDLLVLVVDGDRTADRPLTGGQLALAVAAEGVLPAALMDSLRSPHGTATYIELQTSDVHTVFATAGLTVTQARLALKPVHAQLRLAAGGSGKPAPTDGDDLLSRLERLQALRQQGALTPAEFEVAKRRVLG